MELNIDNKTTKYLFEYAFSKANGIRIISIDSDDFNKSFDIYIDKNDTTITSIEEDVLTDEENSFLIWWKEWSYLEGKFVTRSNHFTKFEFID